MLMTKKSHRQRFKENFELLIMTVPAVIFFAVFYYFPMAGSIVAFKNFNYIKGIWGSPFIGFKNFEFFFTSQDAWRVTRNTVGYGIVFIITGIISAVLVALLLSEIHKRITIKVYQTILILPYFLSWVIVSFITYLLLSPNGGVFNQLRSAFGLEDLMWYSEPFYWIFILPLANIWKTVGLNSIMYYAALLGVDKDLYEAAELDGAGKLRQIINISIPALVPLMTVLSILSIGNLFRGDFGLFYQLPMNIGMLYPTTDIIDTYVYRGLRTGDIGITAAVGLFQSFMGLILVVLSNGIVRKINPDNSMF